MNFHKDTTCSRTTGWVTSEYYYWHDTQNWCGFLEPSTTLQPGLHFENPETKRRIQNLVQVSGLDEHLRALKPQPVNDEIIRLVHPQTHIDHIRGVCESGGGDSGSLTAVGPASLEIANLAVGGVLAAIDALYSNIINNAYILCRPPGHHALPNLAMGFCVYANAAIGIKYAQQQYGVGKVVTLDWDVHHGNGTEAIFIDDPNTLTISMHQDNLYPPDSGNINQPAGGISNINIPLPAGSGSGAYRSAFEKIVMPAIDRFQPDLVVIPSGFDSCALDPLGRQMLTSDDYRWMTKQLMFMAEKYCKGKLLACHEGGYSATYAPYCGIAVLEELSGASKFFEDPYKNIVSNYGGQDLSYDQEKAIERVENAYL